MVADLRYSLERLERLAARRPELHVSAMEATEAVKRYTALTRARAAGRSVIDASLAAISTDALLSSTASFDIDDLDPHLLEAFETAFPSKDIAELSYESPEQWRGLVSAWQGKYFEVLARERLNAGEHFGHLRLAPGQEAGLAEDISQTGWDLWIADESGEIVKTVQLKATQCIDYVREALERYPDEHIVATADLAHHAPAMPLFDVDQIYVDELTESLDVLAGELSVTYFDELAKGLLVIAAPVVIFGSEALRYRRGQSTPRQAGRRIVGRLSKLGVASGVGWGVNSLISGAGLPAVFTTRVGMDIVRSDALRRKLIERRMAEAEQVVAACSRREHCTSRSRSF